MITYRCPCCGDGIAVRLAWIDNRWRLVCTYCERPVTLIPEED